MNQIETNFFGINCSPEILQLYETVIHQEQIIKIPANTFVQHTKNSIVSLIPIENAKAINPRQIFIEWIIKKAILKKLEENKVLFDFDIKWGEFSTIESVLKRDEYSILKRYHLKIIHIDNRIVLIIKPSLKVYNKLSLEKLIELKFPATSTRNCLIFAERDDIRRWVRGILHEYDTQQVKVEIPDFYKGTIRVKPSRVIPLLSSKTLSDLLINLKVKNNIPTEIYESKNKFYGQIEKEIRSFFEKSIKVIFPLILSNYTIDIDDGAFSLNDFKLINTESKSDFIFIAERQGVQSKNRKRIQALSEFNIESNIEEKNVVLFTTKETSNTLRNICRNLNDGITSGRFKFSLPLKLGIRLRITDEFCENSYSEYLPKINRFVQSTEEKHQAFPLIFLPLSSELYYPIKAKLASYGKVSQIISKNLNDIYSLWNLGVNLYAKFGGVPWGILSEESEGDADIFLGFSTSVIKSEGRLQKNIGYVNVFDKNGIWQFMQSSTDFIDFSKRLKQIPLIIQNALDAYLASGKNVEVVDIHYSKRFSNLERQKCFEAISELVPSIKEVNFISVNKYHPYIFFRSLDSSRVVQISENEFIINTNNISNGNRLFSIIIWSLPDPNSYKGRINLINERINKLSNLNWRSAVKDTTEPVTIKYAEEIAKLVNHFTLTDWKIINNQLSKTPWFI